MTFNDHCTKQGIELLREDIRFIKRCLLTIERKDHRAILREYANVWIKAMANEPSELKKQGTARRQANLFLLELY